MRTDENGAYGVCVFPDGSECDEWAFFRGECGPGSTSDSGEGTVSATGPAATGDAIGGGVGGGGPVLGTSGGVPVVGWLGAVVSTPAGAQFDDYVVLMPEGAGEVGIEGADGSIEARIVALRDREEPSKYAHF